MAQLMLPMGRVAAGQTGSGKTHTIMGERHEAGAIALAIDDVFAIAAAAPDDEFAFRVCPDAYLPCPCVCSVYAVVCQCSFVMHVHVCLCVSVFLWSSVTKDCSSLSL